MGTTDPGGAPRPPKGPRVGPYVLLRELARGGMGVVYLAEHAELGRRVALKAVLTPPGEGGELTRRFLSEAQAAAALRHPSIVTIHELGEHQGHPYMVMELVDGSSLQEHLRRGPFTVPEALRIALALARALEYAHGRGVLHRDLKPDNVLLRARDGVPLIADFGLAKVTGGESLTQSGAVLGTPAYMPPEQASGGGDVDGRADVYGLGATLYALLTGDPPFAGKTAINVLFQVLQRQPEPPSRRRPGLSPEVDRVCLVALAKDPAHRQPSAAALAEDLRALLAAPEGPGPRPRLRRGAILAAGLTALALAGGLAAVALQGVHAGAVAVAEAARADAGAAGGAGDVGAETPGLSEAERDAGSGPAEAPTAAVAPRVRWREARDARAREPALGPLWDARLAFDEARGRVVLYGGTSDDAHDARRETFEWNGESWQFSAIGPPARYGHGMVYDPEGAKLVVYGGRDPSRREVGDLWEREGVVEEWFPLLSPGMGPGARSSHAMVYDPNGMQILIFGGQSSTRDQRSDLLSLRRGRVTSLDEGATGDRPPPRINAAAGFDASRGRLVVFGGAAGWGAAPVYDDLWEWEPARGWAQRARSDPWPAPRREAAAVHVGRWLLLFGGKGVGEDLRFDDLWAWDGAAGRWFLLEAGEGPRARQRAAITYDARRDEVVLYGGNAGGLVLGDTWVLTVEDR